MSIIDNDKAVKLEEHTAISAENAFEFLYKNEDLRNFVKRNHMIFIDGYFVVAQPKYIERRGGKIHLTQYARDNIEKCAINIIRVLRTASTINNSEHKYSEDKENSDADGKSEAETNSSIISNSHAAVHVRTSIMLPFPFVAAYAPILPLPLMGAFTSIAATIGNMGATAIGKTNSKDKSEIDKWLLLLNNEYVTVLEDILDFEESKGIHGKLHKITSDDIYDSALNFLLGEEYELEKKFDYILGNPDKTLSECLQFMLNAKNLNEVNVFVERTLLHRNYFTKIKNNKFNSVKKRNINGYLRWSWPAPSHDRKSFP